MTAKEIKVNRLALTWWIYLTLIPGITFIPFAYAGFSSKDRKLVYCSYIYFLPVMLVDYLPDLSVIAWIGGIIHAFAIKNKYINRRLELKYNDLNKFSNLATVKNDSTNKKEVVKIKMQKDIEEELKEEIPVKTIQEDNNVLRENKKVQLDLGETSNKLVDIDEKRNQLVDINYCSEEELEKLPFINSIIAKKAIQQREAIGSFSSVEEFGISIGLKPHIIEKIRPLVLVREKNIKEDKKEKGRVIDL